MTDTTPAADVPTGRNVQQVLAELLHTTARRDAINARIAELRTWLDTEARRRWAADGAAPSWKVPRLGSAALDAVDVDPNVAVTDPTAYSEWLTENYPTEVDQVITIPGAVLARSADDPLVAGAIGPAAALLLTVPGIDFDYRPQPKFIDALVKGGRCDVESGRLADANGVLVDGVTVTAKQPYLTVRLNPEAKARAAAELAIATTAADVPAPSTDEDEGAGSAPPPEPQPDQPTPDRDPAAPVPDPAAPPPPSEVPAEGPERTSTITVGDPEPAGADTLAERIIAADRDARR